MLGVRNTRQSTETTSLHYLCLMKASKCGHCSGTRFIDKRVFLYLAPRTCLDLQSDFCVQDYRGEGKPCRREYMLVVTSLAVFVMGKSGNWPSEEKIEAKLICIMKRLLGVGGVRLKRKKKNRVSLCFIGNFKVWKKKPYLDEHRRCNDGNASICGGQSGRHWPHVSTWKVDGVTETLTFLII